MIRSSTGGCLDFPPHALKRHHSECSSSRRIVIQLLNKPAHALNNRGCPDCTREGSANDIPAHFWDAVQPCTKRKAVAAVGARYSSLAEIE